MAAEEEDDHFPNHKLCGYLLPILFVSPPQTLTPLTPIILSPKLELGFETPSGTLLSPIEDSSVILASNSKKNKRKRDGGGVVSMMHRLVSGKCLKLKGRVLRGFCGKEEGRVIVLVDVYLPVEIWDGWQFPKAGALAGAFFKHVSCNWEARRSLLDPDNNVNAHPRIDYKSVWNCSDCHVLGCEHTVTSGTDDTKSFDLHEIFKTLPTVEKKEKSKYTQINSVDLSISPGIWDLADDMLIKVLMPLSPKDLIRVSATCHHFKALSASVMPCMKLKLFPHQEAAVDWMWKREHNVESLPHPLFINLVTVDGFPLYINTVSGEICSGMAPTINDFRGGMFCDEPGLGKTVTSLSLILKTHGSMAEPPDGVDVVWCMHDAGKKCGYYEVSGENFTSGKFMLTSKRFTGQNVQRGNSSGSNSSSEINSVESSKSSGRRSRSMTPKSTVHGASSIVNSNKSVIPATRLLRCTQGLNSVERNLLDTFEKVNSHKGNKRKCNAGSYQSNETWVQCDACKKWRKLNEMSILDASVAWFCSMNTDSAYQSCAVSEETWHYKQKITYFPGFYTKSMQQGKDENVSFFTNVLKEHSALLNSETMKALTWLANLPYSNLLELETIGLRRPAFSDLRNIFALDTPGYHKIFRAFGLVKKVERHEIRWFYPSNLESLEFDLDALKIALTKPLDLFRLYLSGATLVVVPANLIEHWKTQIQKHVTPGQLRVYVWNDSKKPSSAHNLAWDYDVVITTFSRLSVEWSLHKRSIFLQVHWVRVILDEGHTLGSSLNLTNKLQMAISLVATNRWILTGTPTPCTPMSQVGHLQPMLKFLHEEVYGQNQESWENGILKPFEVENNEGRLRLVALLSTIMISARKEDLKNIPPCIKKSTFINFNEEHARSYNELVVTVKRNILMADWNDPSHVESLLNPKQWKLRSNTIRNVRLSCCVAGHIKVTEAGQDIQETMDIFVGQGLDPLSDEYVFIRSSLIHGCSCFRCKEWCRLPFITPCRHLLCLDCVSLDSEKCTYLGCGNLYEMQSPEILRRLENPNPKWPVPKDLIELQPSYDQDDWDPDWQSTSSSKVAYLVEKLKNFQKSNKKVYYDEESIHTEEIIMHSQKNNCQDKKTIPKGQSCDILPDKAIIFSQFLEHIHVIEQQLTVADINYTGMYSPMQSSSKMKSLLTFQQEPTCMVLIMDGSAALGLDLSFVTHIFLMEPIWDRSMEEQVISRAHRMGATRPIYVETLAMRGTIEEQMLEFLQNASMSRRVLKQEIDQTNSEGARVHRTVHDFAQNNYLSHLSFVHTYAKA